MKTCHPRLILLSASLILVLSQSAMSVKETGASSGTDPQFVNAVTGDLRLKVTNPVEDAGVRVKGSK